MTLPLEGIRVLDLTTVLSGPLCTMMLADAGADVIKIEPPGGDPARGMGPPFWGDEGCEFLALNRNKRSICLNLKTAGGRKVFLRLCETADVVVENFRTGVVERLGIDHETLRAVNPRLIYCSISGFGRTGPRRDQPAYDSIMQAFVGIMKSTGTADGPPVRSSVSVCDIGAGMYANQAILLALMARERTGRGQRVETSLFEAQVAWMLFRAVGYFATGKAPAGRWGSASPHLVPYQAYPTKDDYVMVGVLNDRLFARLAEAVGLPELAGDPRFVTNKLRVAHRAELNAILEARFRQQTTAVWVEAFTRAGIPASPINSIEDVLNDPQTDARQMILTLLHPAVGEIKVPGPAIKFSESQRTSHLPPPLLGQHTEEILSELGYGPADQERLRREGAIHLGERGGDSRRW